MEELNTYSQTESPGILIWQAMAVFQQQQQWETDITEMHISTPFFSIFFYQKQIQKKWIIIYLELDCRESNNSANCV